MQVYHNSIPALLLNSKPKARARFKEELSPTESKWTLGNVQILNQGKHSKCVLEKCREFSFHKQGSGTISTKVYVRTLFWR